MPLDGLMLGYIVTELRPRLIGGRVDKVTQPEKDEINLLIRCGGENRLLLLSASANHARAHLTAEKKANPLEPPMLCMLLRKHLTGARVKDIAQPGGDRILAIAFEALDELGETTERRLVLEIMGRHSNLMLLNAAGVIIDSARHVTDDISRVRQVLPGLMYEMPPAQDKLTPNQAADAGPLHAKLLMNQTGGIAKSIGASVMGISAATAQELAFRVSGDEAGRFGAISPGEAALEVAAFFAELPPCEPRLLLSEEGAPLDVTPFPYLSRAGLEQRGFPTLSGALDAFFMERDRHARIAQKSSALNRVLKNNIERCEKKLALQLSALKDSERMQEYRIKGELLTASAHLVRKGVKAVSLPNYYDENMAEIEIALDEKLSPAQNAQRFFKLYQKAKSAQELAAEQQLKTEAELEYLENQLNNLAKCEYEAELNEIRDELTREGYVRANHNRRQMKKLPPSKPHRYVSSEGEEIFVGKNNQQNDQLTASAAGEDIWLHAKDIPGSHVLIRSAAPSETTLREAAMLAAYFSKGKTGSNVPVDYTKRKHVKKPGGAKPGFVIYTHQHTLYVTPDEGKTRAMATEG